MSEKAMSEALDAIHDEAMKLLQHELPEEVRKGLDLHFHFSYSNP